MFTEFYDADNKQLENLVMFLIKKNVPLEEILPFTRIMVNQMRCLIEPNMIVDVIQNFSPYILQILIKQKSISPK